jgi:site-specific DNA-methyltransferase (adenine-specific)
MAERLKTNSVDVVVTSPPYNIGVKYQAYNDRIPRREYLEWITQWGKAVGRVLKDSGSLFLNVGSKPTSPEVPFQVLGALTGQFRLQNVIHWIKSIYIESGSYGNTVDINVGHYKPINSERFLNDNHEYIFHLTKTGKVRINRLAMGVPYKDETNIARWRSGASRLRCRGNCWFIPYQTIQNRANDRPHPASFPPQLAENCIRLHGLRKTMTVLDPFMGLGNTGLACRKLEVKFVGFEIDSYYFEKARLALGIKAGK